MIRLAEFVIAMLGLGISIPRVAVRSSDAESSGGGGGASTIGQPIGLFPYIYTKAS